MITNSFQTEKLLEMRIHYLVTSSFLNDDNKANAMVKRRSFFFTKYGSSRCKIICSLGEIVFCWVEGNGFIPNDRTPCLSSPPKNAWPEIWK